MMDCIACNLIYGVPAQYPDAAHHGNHWNMKCIFYYLHNQEQHHIENLLKSTFKCVESKSGVYI